MVKVKAGATVKDGTKYDFGTPELRKRFEWRLINSPEGGGKCLKSYGHPLDFYERKKLITTRQHNAGEKLMKDFEVGSFQRMGIAGYTRGMVDHSSRSPDYLTHRTVAARESFYQAMKFLDNDISCTLAYEVCCFGEYIRKILPVSVYVTVPPAMARLKETLEKLADFYGLPI